MKKPRRAPTTVYLTSELARAAKVKAALLDKSFSDVVNDSLARSISLDAAHLTVFQKRKNERARSYEEFLIELKRDGLI